jgi:creatinine amidohydrolase
MRGREATETIQECPVGYLPIGCLERHGDHLPMGLDVLKAHGICCMAAQETGGVVFPPHFYAGIHNLPEDKKKKLTGEWGNLYTDDTAKENLVELIHQISVTGIRVLILYSGHYPGCQTEMIKDIAEHAEIRVIPFVEPIVLQGDHAGISETSLMLYVDKEKVDMSSISDINYHDHNWTDENTPEKATYEKGKKDIQKVIDYLCAEIEKIKKEKT